MQLLDFLCTSGLMRPKADTQLVSIKKPGLMIVAERLRGTERRIEQKICAKAGQY